MTLKETDTVEPDFVRNRITELRVKKGIAEHRMSLELGHSRSYMQSISAGRALPSMTEFLAICDYLEVTPRDFFDETCGSPCLTNKILQETREMSDADLLLLLNIINRFKQGK